MKRRLSYSSHDDDTGEVHTTKVAKIQAKVWKKAAFERLGIQDFNRANLIACKIKPLKSLCADFNLSVSNTGIRGLPIKRDYIDAILGYARCFAHNADNQYTNIERGDVAMVESSEPSGRHGREGTNDSVKILFFRSPKDYRTCFVAETVYPTQPDGSIDLASLARSMSFQDCQIIDPFNFHPLHTPSGIVAAQYISEYLRKEGFLRMLFSSS